MRRAGLLVVLGCAWLAPRIADACSEEAPAAFAGVAPIPHMGTVAPTNTWIWIPAPTDPLTLTVKANGADIAFDTSSINVTGEHGAMFIVIPQTPLPAGASVVVSQGTQMLTQFTVGTGADDTAPSPPAIEHVEIYSGYFGAFYCVEDSKVTLRAAYDADLLIIDEQHGTALPATALGLSTPPSTFATASALSEGDHDLRLIAVDQAGNSTVVAVPQVTIPAEQYGCSTTRSTSASWIFAVLAVLGGRRRRQSERAQRKPMCEKRRVGS